jgi:hypothetical protein
MRMDRGRADSLSARAKISPAKRGFFFALARSIGPILSEIPVLVLMGRALNKITCRVLSHRIKSVSPDG